MNSTFVGRHLELSQLAHSVRRAQDGHGQLVTVSGEAGIGKTRLMSEIAHVAAASGSNVLWGQMIEDPVAPPYTAWTLALRAYLQQVDDDTLRDDLGSGAEPVADILPELRDRLAMNDSQRPAGSDAAARYQLFDCVSRLLLALAKRQPLVLLFDNLHLADESSLLLLEHYSHQLTSSRSLVIAAHRDGATAASDAFERLLTSFGRTAESEQFRLTGLDRDHVGQLLRNVSGSLQSPALVDAVYTRGDGNPLFTCQVAQTLIGRKPEFEDALAEHSFEIPYSLGEAIASRFATVGQDVLRVLGNAAVLGRDFDASLLAGACGLNLEEVFDLVEQSVAAGIVVCLAPGRYRFEHALFREVLYTKQSSANKLRLHHSAAKSLSARYEGEAEAPLAQLAYHWFEASRGGYYPQAVEWCRRAAAAAVEKRAYGEATLQIEHALALIEMAPDENPELRFELLCALGSAQFHAGQQGLSNHTWLKASFLARRNGWPERLAESVLEWQYVRAGTGYSHEQAVPLHEAALELLPTDAVALRTRVLASLAQAYRHRVDYELACKTMHESVELARKIGDPGVLFDCLIKAFYIVTRASDASLRLPMLEEALQLAPLTGREENVLLASAALLFPLSDLGRFDDVRRKLADLVRQAHVSRHLYWQQFAAGFKVKLAILDGRWDDALQTAQESLRQGSYQGATGIEGRFGFQMFTIHRARGTLGAVAPLLLRISATDNDSRTWLPGRILLHCELGQKQEALKALSQLGDFEDLADDDLYETALAYLAEACARLGVNRKCQSLYELLKPFRGSYLNLVATLSHGSASGYLAMLATTLQRETEARELFEEALKQYENCGAPVFLAQTRFDYAALLLASEIPKDKSQAVRLIAQARTAAERYDLKTLVHRIDSLTDESAIRINLTDRELDVLTLMAAGSSNKRIAQKLSISLATVATHVRNILRKTATRNRTEAVALARKNALLPPD